MDHQANQQVRSRQVFYIPGYDPIHPRRYRELYRKEGAAQAAISGYDLTLSPKPTTDTYGWRVAARIDGQQVQTEVDVLVWSDIVRDSMDSSIAATYLQLLRTAWIYVSTGALGRLMRLRKGPVIAALYPIGMLIAQLILSVLVGLALGTFAGWAVRTAMGAVITAETAALAGQAAAASVALLMAVATLRWWKRKDGKLFAHYLMLDYAHSASLRGAYPQELEDRLAAFRTTILAALRSDVDEVLIVGHSSGAHLAISILADLIRDKAVPSDGPALSFLSLGQVVPMVSFLPEAHRLRADLQTLSTQDTLPWVDVTAPGDGCAFALCDPVAVSGVATDGKTWPLVFSAAFTQTLSPARWKALRWRFFRLHFQYLCAFDRPKDYDYFQITAGPQTLRARYAGRPPSKSRIDHAVSKYTSVAA